LIRVRGGVVHSSIARALVAAGAAIGVLFLLAAGAHQASIESKPRVPPLPQRYAVEAPTGGEPMSCSEFIAQEAGHLRGLRDVWFTRC
jgi:hypothetical protein